MWLEVGTLRKPNLQGGEGGWRLSSIMWPVTQSYKSLLKPLNSEAQWTSWLVNTLMCRKGDAPDSTGEAWELCVPSHTFSHVSIWLVLLICTLYNEPVKINIMSFWILRVALVNYWTWGDCGNHWKCSQSQKCRWPGDTGSVVGAWSKDSCVGVTPSNLWGLC